MQGSSQRVLGIEYYPENIQASRLSSFKVVCTRQSLAWKYHGQCQVWLTKYKIFNFKWMWEILKEF